MALIGTIKSDDIRIAFMKLNLKLSTTDIETMLRYFDIVNQKEIEIQEFVKGLLNKYKSLEPEK